MNKSPLYKFLIPILPIVILLILNHYLSSMSDEINLVVGLDILSIIANMISISLYLSIAFFIIRFTNILIFNYILENKLSYQIPKLLIDIHNTLVVIGFILTIFNQVFFVPLTGLLTATSALSVVLGFALKDILADIFAGIALNVEKPFKIGDDIELDNGVVGTVKDITWRATHIEEPTRIITIIPNAKMNNMQMKNYHKNARYYQERLSFHLNHNIPTKRVLRIVTSALKDENLNLNFEISDVHVIEINELGVKYGVRFFVSDISSLYPVRSKLLCKIMDNLYQSGLTPSHPNQDIFFSEMPATVLNNNERKEFVISKLELFETLNSQEKNILMGRLKERKYSIGDVVVSQGDEGSSLFILVEGLLEVKIKDKETAKEYKVASLQAGNSFGEFSLLTGEKRSASVVVEHDSIIYELQKEDFAPLLENNIQLANQLALILAKRQLSSKETIENFCLIQNAEETKKAGKNILEKMSTVFSFLKK